MSLRAYTRTITGMAYRECPRRIQIPARRLRADEYRSQPLPKKKVKCAGFLDPTNSNLMDTSSTFKRHK